MVYIAHATWCGRTSDWGCMFCHALCVGIEIENVSIEPQGSCWKSVKTTKWSSHPTTRSSSHWLSLRWLPNKKKKKKKKKKTFCQSFWVSHWKKYDLGAARRVLRALATTPTHTVGIQTPNILLWGYFDAWHHQRRRAICGGQAFFPVHKCAMEILAVGYV